MDRRKTVCRYLELDRYKFDGSLQNIIQYLTDLQKEVPEDTRLQVGGDEYVVFNAYYYTLETEEEYQKRLQYEQKLEARDLELYKNLKKKFEGDK